TSTTTLSKPLSTTTAKLDQRTSTGWGGTSRSGGGWVTATWGTTSTATAYGPNTTSKAYCGCPTYPNLDASYSEHGRTSAKLWRSLTRHRSAKIGTACHLPSRRR